MTNILKLLFIGVVLTLPSHAEINPKKLTVDGTFLGIYNSIQERQTQFDFASNINFNYELSPQLNGTIQFQSSPGNGSLGFVGPSVNLTDAALTYSPNIKNHSMSITFGSFDTPIGYETNFLTNNANTFANQFIINSLTYSALGGTVGTLNTLGIKIHNKYKYLDLTSSVSNGTSETAYNEKSTFERLTQLSLHSFIKGLRLTTTYFESNDQADTQDSLQTNLTVQLVEANYTLNKSFKLKLKTAKLTFDDNNSNTNDDIDTYEAEINYNKAAYLFGLRGSFWRPQGSPISSDTPNPGLATSRNTNEAVDRIQISAGYYINTNTVFKLEYFTDFYAGGFGQKSDTYQGLISGINIKF